MIHGPLSLFLSLGTAWPSEAGRASECEGPPPVHFTQRSETSPSRQPLPSQRTSYWVSPTENREASVLFLLKDLTWRELILIIGAAGMASLLIRGIEESWPRKRLPFGDLKECNEIIQDETCRDFNVRLERLGKAFTEHISKLSLDLTMDLYREPESGNPTQLVFQYDGLIGLYIQDLSETHQNFQTGLTTFDEEEPTGRYESAFKDLLQGTKNLIDRMETWYRAHGEKDFQVFHFYNEKLKTFLREFDISPNAH